MLLILGTRFILFMVKNSLMISRTSQDATIRGRGIKKIKLRNNLGIYLGIIKSTRVLLRYYLGVMSNG